MEGIEIKIFYVAWSILITSVTLILMYIVGYTFLSVVTISENTATIISGLLSALGGVIGAIAVYRVAIWQTNKNIKLDQQNRIKRKKIEKLEELQNAFVKTYFVLTDVYPKVNQQLEMLKRLVDIKANVFVKDNFITNEIESEYVKAVIQLQSFKITIMNNLYYLPIRIDSLELLTATQQMSNFLSDLQKVYELKIDNRSSRDIDIESDYHKYCKHYEALKNAIQDYVGNTKKYIDNDIEENLK